MKTITDLNGSPLNLGDTVVAEAVQNMKLSDPESPKLMLGVVTGLGWEEQTAVVYPQGTLTPDGSGGRKRPARSRSPPFPA